MMILLSMESQSSLTGPKRNSRKSFPSKSLLEEDLSSIPRYKQTQPSEIILIKITQTNAILKIKPHADHAGPSLPLPLLKSELRLPDTKTLTLLSNNAFLATEVPKDAMVDG